MKSIIKKLDTPRGRRVFVVVICLVYVITYESIVWYRQSNLPRTTQVEGVQAESIEAISRLDLLEVKGRAPFTGYARSQYGDGWAISNGCDTRNRILARDLSGEVLANDGCKVVSGTLTDPYTGRDIVFVRGTQTSSGVQIDHVVALADAWQKGAQGLSKEIREAFANDPLNLLAVDGKANTEKGSSDAATWLPPNKQYRCQYVARQIEVKYEYGLWVTRAEYNSMQRVLRSCPGQRVPIRGGLG